MKLNVIVFAFVALTGFACSSTQKSTEFISSTEASPWEVQAAVIPGGSSATVDVMIDPSKVEQTIEGFGTCFNELGWTSLQRLEPQVRDGILKELFSPGVGANFTMGRMPVGANDFSVDWYSYNETDKDFEMTNFSIDHDKATLVPFIKEAQKYLPSLRIWASPWSPPSWMKHNKHYASRSSFAPRVDNGLPKDRQGHEGTDMFIREEPYLKAYALYFSKFIDAYRSEGIDIFAVMPQNEFNSAQIFPSCCWTATGLADFVGNYLGPAMDAKGVDVMFGTMERPNEALVDTILNDPVSGKYIKGVGFQWAGKNALPGLHKRYPNLRLYQTEQECGDGQNDLRGAVYSWNLMKHYLNNGVSAYMYWNTSLMQGGISTWGWRQNSLVVVNEDNSFNYTLEYYVMKHVSHFVEPGAKKLTLEGSYDDVLAFLNPDNSLVVVAGNQDAVEKVINIKVNSTSYSPTLKANSLNTLIIR
ncbi:glycosyl hydrolase [Bacteroidia bacterium]|nr:glycosyl hydrolase [Bacteroidia bacterium]